MPTCPPLPPLERIWQGLRPHVEWADELALIFLFAAGRELAEALLNRIEESMRAQVKNVRVLRPATADDLVGETLSNLLSTDEAEASLRIPLWVDASAMQGEDAWDRARIVLLARLNERRGWLEAHHRRALILVLPGEWLKRAAETAPDLWTIRVYSAFLEPDIASAVDAASDWVSRPANGAVAENSGRLLPPSIARWRQLRIDRRDEAPLWDANFAIDEAVSAGALAVAAEIAREAEVIARNRAARSNGGGGVKELRDLSISLIKVGEIEQALGRLDDAGVHYQESENLGGRLLEKYGETPEWLRDVAVSAERLADLARAQGELGTAREAFSREVNAAQRSISLFGESVPVLEVAGYGHYGLWQTETALGNVEEATRHGRQALDIYRRLIKVMPQDIRYLRALNELQEARETATKGN